MVDLRKLVKYNKLSKEFIETYVKPRIDLDDYEGIDEYDKHNRKNNNIARKIPNKIKNWWYKESKIIPKNICKNAEEKSINNFEVPF
jgi:hypothetical protein